jgi:hypothetical protein
MMNVQSPTVWQLMAAFASDEYEFREVAPGEYEIVPIGPPGAGDESLAGTAEQHEDHAAAAEHVSADER